MKGTIYYSLLLVEFQAGRSHDWKRHLLPATLAGHSPQDALERAKQKLHRIKPSLDAKIGANSRRHRLIEFTLDKDHPTLGKTMYNLEPFTP